MFSFRVTPNMNIEQVNRPLITQITHPKQQKLTWYFHTHTPLTKNITYFITSISITPPIIAIFLILNINILRSIYFYFFKCHTLPSTYKRPYILVCSNPAKHLKMTADAPLHQDLKNQHPTTVVVVRRGPCGSTRVAQDYCTYTVNPAGESQISKIVLQLTL